MTDLPAFRRHLAHVLDLLKVDDPAKVLRWIAEAALRDVRRELREIGSRLAAREVLDAMGYGSEDSKAALEQSLHTLNAQLQLALALKNLLGSVAADPWPEVVKELKKK